MKCDTQIVILLPRKINTMKRVILNILCIYNTIVDVNLNFSVYFSNPKQISKNYTWRDKIVFERFIMNRRKKNPIDKKKPPFSHFQNQIP